MALLQTVAPVAAIDSDSRLHRIRQEIHQQLIAGLNLSSVDSMDDYQLRTELRRAAEELCQYRADLLTPAERKQLINELIDEILGLGPLEPLLNDPTVSDILINGPKTVYVERRGMLESTGVSFHDEQHLVEIVQRVASRVGRRIDESSPMVDARLADGSRVNAILRPLAVDGALVSIRRFGERPLLASDLMARRAATKEMIEFLAACVQARLNIVISGGTGSGKTTLLNVLSGFIPPTERIVTIEDAVELQLQQPHVARLETRLPNLEGTGEVTTRDLLRNALRMRPDRIVIGECRGAEAFDMLQAMTTGHEGSLTTVHANHTRDALHRMEMLVGIGNSQLPMWFIHRQIASSINILVQLSRLSGGARKIVQISEVAGMEAEVVNMHDLFTFVQTGLDDQGAAQGQFRATGIRPLCLERIRSAGIDLAANLFEDRVLEPDRLADLQWTKA